MLLQHSAMLQSYSARNKFLVAPTVQVTNKPILATGSLPPLGYVCTWFYVALLVVRTLSVSNKPSSGWLVVWSLVTKVGVSVNSSCLC